MRLLTAACIALQGCSVVVRSTCICPTICKSTIRCWGSTKRSSFANLPNTAAVIVIFLIRCSNPRRVDYATHFAPRLCPRRLGFLEALDISSAVDRTNGLATCMALCSSHTLCWPSGLLWVFPVARVCHAIGSSLSAVTLHGHDRSLNLQSDPLRLTHFKARHER